MLCDDCDALNINGILCHEIGCPSAWKNYNKKCRWCGTTFLPKEKDHEFCCVDCHNDYYGIYK